MAPVRRADVRAAGPERAAREPDLVQGGANVVLGRRRGEVRAADLGHVGDLARRAALLCGTGRKGEGGGTFLLYAKRINTETER